MHKPTTGASHILVRGAAALLMTLAVTACTATVPAGNSAKDPASSTSATKQPHSQNSKTATLNPTPALTPRETAAGESREPSGPPETSPVPSSSTVVVTHDNVTLRVTPSPVGVYIACEATNTTGQAADITVTVKAAGDTGFQATGTFTFEVVKPGGSDSGSTTLSDTSGAEIPDHPVVTVTDITYKEHPTA